ncbi:MAG: hypothetical protein GY804_03585 [Alphaproteobacteria bacterium]|nr:hypothetical protein [Alphaproteobacteria bacterium]
MADVSGSFIKHYQADVHLAYQQTGTKLRSTVRSKDSIVGATTTFQKVGKGTASTKDRHGLVPTMSLDHTPVECTLQDYYAGDWADALDELKMGSDERKTITEAGAYALGRKSDELIIDALAASTTEIGDYSTGVTKNLVLQAFEQLNANDVPDDGQRFGIVGVHQWSELLNMPEFSDADYVGDQYQWLKGSESRRWLGIIWIMHNGLPVADTDNRDCFIYHRSAIGHAVGQDVKSDITWHGDRAAHFVSNSMSQGATIIDTNGVIKLKLDDNIAIA